MVPKNILICFSLSLLKLTSTDAFQTDQCDHENLTSSLRKLQTCMNAEDEGDDDDICSTFQSTRECVTNNLKECFTEDDVQMIANETVALVRQSVTKLVLSLAFQKAQGFVLSEAEVDSLYSTCPNVPDKSFSENVKAKQFFVLEAGVRTDKNCTEDQITEVNVGLGECQKNEMENAKAQLSRRIRSSRGSIQSTICSVLYDTIGKCLRKPLPDCFSEREVGFLKTTMSENLITLFKEVEELMGAKQVKISFSECSVFTKRNIFSDSRIICPSSIMFYIVLAISSFFMIN